MKKYMIYEALDGKKFDDEEECKSYESKYFKKYMGFTEDGEVTHDPCSCDLLIVKDEELAPFFRGLDCTTDGIVEKGLYYWDGFCAMWKQLPDSLFNIISKNSEAIREFLEN